MTAIARPRRSPRSTLARRGFVALLALLYVAALVATGLHRAQVAHSVCEHGELVHAEGSAAAGERAGGGLELGAGQDEHERDLHEHCSIATADRLAGTPSAPPCATWFVAPAWTCESLHAGAPRVEAIPRLRLAPHHSPPLT